MPTVFSDILESLNHPPTAHAAMVHLPIALALLAPLFLLAAGLMPGRRRMGSLLAAIAYALLAISTLVAIQSGEAAYDAIGAVPPEVGTMAYEHGEMAERVWTWGLVGAVLSCLGLAKKKGLAVGGVWAALAFGVFTAGWAGVAAHKGGELVYHHGVGTPNPVIPETETDGPDDPRMAHFLTNVKPVLVERCFGCHRPGREKGGLDMTSMRALLEGAEHGPVLRPGYPQASMLLTVIKGEHPEVSRMPKGRGGALTREQIEAIRLWIEQGAVWDQ